MRVKHVDWKEISERQRSNQSVKTKQGKKNKQKEENHINTYEEILEQVIHFIYFWDTHDKR